MKKLLFTITVLFLSAIESFAVQVPSVLTEPMKQVLKQSPEIPSITNVLISTLLMVLFIYAIAFIYQKLSIFNKKKFTCSDDKVFNLNKLKIINTMSLGANKSVHIVEVNGKYLVLGSTPASITLLKEFDKNSLNNLENPELTGEPQKPTEEVIEQGLKTLYPEEEIQEETPDENFEEIYKKYI